MTRNTAIFLSLLALGLAGLVAFTMMNEGRQVTPKMPARPTPAPTKPQQEAAATASAPAKLADLTPPADMPPGTYAFEGPRPDLRYWKAPNGNIRIEGNTRTAKFRDGRIMELPVTLDLEPNTIELKERSGAHVDAGKSSTTASKPAVQVGGVAK